MPQVFQSELICRDFWMISHHRSPHAESERNQNEDFLQMKPTSEASCALTLPISAHQQGLLNESSSEILSCLDSHNFSSSAGTLNDSSSEILSCKEWKKLKWNMQSSCGTLLVSQKGASLLFKWNFGTNGQSTPLVTYIKKSRYILWNKHLLQKRRLLCSKFYYENTSE